MSFSINDTKRFAAIIQTLSDMAEDAVFRITNTKLTIRALSTTNASGLAVEMNIGGGIENAAFGIKLADFVKSLKVLKNPATFYVQGEALEIHEGNKRHTLAIYDPQHIKEMPRTIPAGPVQFDIPTKDWQDLIKETTLYTQTLEFRTGGESLIITGREEGIKNSVTNELALFTTTPPKATSRYNAAYIHPVFHLTRVFEQVRVSFNDDYPLVLAYQEGGCELFFFLAPTAKL